MMFDFERYEKNDFLIDFKFIDTPVYIKDIRLFQVGKKFCNQETVVEPHTHIDWFELTIILDGKGVIHTNKQSVSVKEGDIHLSYPCDIHSIESDKDAPMKYAFLSFCLEKSNFKPIFDQIAQSFFEANTRIFTSPFIPNLIEAIINEMTSENYEKETVVYACLQQILTYVCRVFLHNKPATGASIGKNEILCYKIMRFIDNNLFNIQNLTDISEYFNYNYSYIAKIFKKTTNTTIAQYFSKRKLERAKILIKENILSFTKISEILNYASIYSFSKSFKLHFGISPAEYKKQDSKTHK